ncbi:MAG: family 16 glycoside hydrolase, partial [Dehalococcoidia bacterium]
ALDILPKSKPDARRVEGILKALDRLQGRSMLKDDVVPQEQTLVAPPVALPEKINVTLSPDRLQVTPGESVETTATIRNTGDVAEAYSIAVEGIDPQWCTLSVSTVSLSPGDEEQVKLTIKPPRTSASKAGPCNVIIRVASSREPSAETTAQLALEVERFLLFDLDLTPKKARGRKGSYRVSITNSGNLRTTYTLAGQDPEDMCRFDFNPQAITVEPGSTTEVPLVVDPKKKPFTRRARTYGFKVTVTSHASEAGESKSVEGQLECTPLLPTWALGVAGLAGVAILAVVVIFAMGGRPTPTPLSIGAIQFCSEEPQGFGDCTLQPDAIYERGDTVWAYFEVSSFAARRVDDAFEVWISETEAKIFDSEGAVYYQWTDLPEVHETRDSAPEAWTFWHWTTLSPEAEPGQYRVEVTVKDRLTAETAVQSGYFTVASPVLFSDDFSDRSSGWDIYSNEEGSAYYGDGRFHVRDEAFGDYSENSYAGQYFTDFVLEVETKLLGGTDENWYGVMSRIDQLGNGYYFDISADGYYEIVKFANGNPIVLREPTLSIHINKGQHVTNLVRIECIGSTLSLSVNGHLLATVTDSTFTGGDIALRVDSIGGPQPTEVAFDNIVVTAP